MVSATFIPAWIPIGGTLLFVAVIVAALPLAVRLGLWIDTRRAVRRVEAVEHALTEAIEHWMEVPPGTDWAYEHGRAQGIAHALAVLRSTTFTVEWMAGLDRYQNRIVIGSE